LGTEARDEMTRSSFLKLAFAAIPGAAALFAAGCGGEEGEEEEEDDD
jgi:hypothetical protein